MYTKTAAIVGLAAAVNAHPGAPPAYGAWGSSSSVVAATGTYYSSAPVSAPAYSTVAPAPSGAPYPACWASCFQAAGITSESDLCGNTEVDACIQQSCSGAEDKAYWAWYESYCPATTSPVESSPAATVPVYSTPATTPSGPIPTASYPACWSACFAENDVTSEAELCGDDAVSQCIYETCDSSADQAYWAWYEGYCTGPATVTSVITLTSPCVESGATSWASTAWTPAGAPTGSTAAPYPTGGAGGSWGSQTASAVAATGTGAWGSSPSGWPVPATGGASVAAKSGFALLAGFLGLVALL